MYDVNCSGAKDYMDLALEIINEKNKQLGQGLGALLTPSKII